MYMTERPARTWERNLPGHDRKTSQDMTEKPARTWQRDQWGLFLTIKRETLLASESNILPWKVIWISFLIFSYLSWMKKLLKLFRYDPISEWRTWRTPAPVMLQRGRQPNVWRHCFNATGYSYVGGYSNVLSIRVWLDFHTELAIRTWLNIVVNS